MSTAAFDFQTETGLQFNGVTSDQLTAMRGHLFSDYGLTPAQVCEAASYSLAMVIRFALGLSANEGRVAAFVDDSLCGWTALATLRHLINAGSKGCAIFLGEEREPSADLALQLAPLSRTDLQITHWKGSAQFDELVDIMEVSHNTICGLYNPDTPQNPLEHELIDILNELHTPVHAIEAPLGVDVNSGAKGEKPLFASSTLSLGAPLRGLSAGSEYAGRHYLCDISFTQELYGSDANLAPLFSEQPVVKIFPAQATAEG